MATEQESNGGSQSLRIPGYQIQELIGKGGMGSVFRARQEALDRVVAIKILPPKLAADEKYIKRFFLEARASAKLNHPNIVSGIDAGRVGPTAYFVMEYVDGSTWGQRIKERGSVYWRDAARTVLQIAEALEHAHKMGMAHRDIKPDNIILTPQGDSKLVDLGLAKQPQGMEETQGYAMGTPHYIAPEQAQARPDVDIRADIYSLGATLYHAVMGHTLFKRDSAKGLFDAHINSTAPPPKTEKPELPDDLVAIMSKMLAKAPGDRYVTPTALVQELTALLEGRPVQIARAFHGKSSVENPVMEVQLPSNVSGRRQAVRAPKRWGQNYSGANWLPIGIGGGVVLILLLAFLFSNSSSPARSPVHKIERPPPPHPLLSPPVTKNWLEPKRNNTAESHEAQASEAFQSVLNFNLANKSESAQFVTKLWAIRDTVRATRVEREWAKTLDGAKEQVLKDLRTQNNRLALLALKEKFSGEPLEGVWQQALSEMDSVLQKEWERVWKEAKQFAEKDDFAAARSAVKRFTESEQTAVAEAARNEMKHIERMERSAAEDLAHAAEKQRLKTDRIRFEMYQALLAASENLDFPKAYKTLNAWQSKPEAHPFQADLKYSADGLKWLEEQTQRAGEELVKERTMLDYSIGNRTEKAPVSEFRDGRLWLNNSGAIVPLPLNIVAPEILVTACGWSGKDKSLEAARFLFWRNNLENSRKHLETAAKNNDAQGLNERLAFMIDGWDKFCSPEPPKDVQAAIAKELLGADGKAAPESTTIPVDLTWKAGSFNTKCFRVERRIGEGAFESIADLQREIPAYKDATAPLNSSLSYRIVAHNTAGDSTPSMTAAITSPAPRSLIPGDFETPDKNWELEGQASVSTTAAHTGTKALLINGAGAALRLFAVKAGKTYKVNGWVKVLKQNIESWGGAHAVLNDGGGKQLGESPLFTQKTASDWVQFKFTFTASSDKALLRLETFCPAEMLLDAAFDDIIVYE